MNWDKIKESYPKAFNNVQIRALDWECKNYTDRCLYDFFDGEGIYVTVRPYNFRVDKWFYSLWGVGEDYGMLEGRSYRTRIEAEEQAFERAFEILENKLNSLNK